MRGDWPLHERVIFMSSHKYCIPIPRGRWRRLIRLVGLCTARELLSSVAMPLLRTWKMKSDLNRSENENVHWPWCIHVAMIASSL